MEEEELVRKMYHFPGMGFTEHLASELSSRYKLKSSTQI